jgi:hypothetical protein
MIPQSTTPKVSYAGNDLVGQFAITFPTFENISIIAAVVDTATGTSIELAEGTDYTLSNIGRPNYNATLTLVVGSPAQVWLTGSNLATGYSIEISFNPQISQPVRLRDLGNQSPEAIERAMDRAVMGVLGLLQRNADLRTEFLNLIADIQDAIANGGALPTGGAAGAALVKQSATDGDAIWDDMAFSGFSARFNAAFSSNGLRDTLAQILQFTYLAPLVSLSASGSGTVREKGVVVSAVTLTANVTRRTDLIARIEFFLNGVSINDNNPPAQTGTGSTVYNWSGTFSDNVTFRVDVTDDGLSGGPTTVQASQNFVFVYPYYYGAGAVGLTAAAVAGLTKNVIVSTASVNRVFTTAAGEVYYFAYPASYGALTSILDENGFQTIGAWTERIENITGLDATAVSYRIYEFNNPVAAGTTNFTFTR